MIQHDIKIMHMDEVYGQPYIPSSIDSLVLY